MALVFTLGGVVDSTTDGTSYTTASFTPAAGDLLIAFVAASATVAPGTFTDTQGNKYTQLGASVKATSLDRQYVFVANTFATATAMTGTFDCTGDAATGANVKFVRVSGMSIAGAAAVRQLGIINNGASGATPAIAFANNVITTNGTLGFIANATNPATLTPPTSWSELSDTGYATPTSGAELVSRVSGFASTTMTWGGTSASAYGGLAIELDAGAAPDTNLVQVKLSAKAATTTNTVVFDKNIVVGHVILIGSNDTTGTLNSISTVTDSLGNTYARQASDTEASFVDGEVWSAPVTTGGACTITVTYSGSTDSALVAAEYAGLLSATVDKIKVAHATTGTAMTSGATAALTQAAEVIVVFGFANGTQSTKVLNGTGYNHLYQVVQPSSGALVAMEDQLVAATTAVTGTMTLSASGHWTIITVTMKVGHPSFTTTHTTSANKRTANTLTHTTSSNKKIAGNLLTHTTDARKRFTFGTTDGTSLSTGGLTQIIGIKYTMPSDGKVSTLSVWSPNTGNFVGAIYSDVSGVPTTLLASNATPAAVAANAWSDISIGPIFLPAGTYWLTAMTSASNMRAFRAGPGGNKVAYNLSTTYGASFPSTFPTPTYSTEDYPIFATYLPAVQATVTHTTDSYKHLGKQTLTVSHTTDSLKRKANTISHTADANKKVSGTTKTHTTDANKKKSYTKTHTTDSFLRKQFTKTHTADANKRLPTLKTHTTDSNRRKATTVSHTTDANKKTAGLTRTHTTDANKKKSGLTLSHTTDSFKRKANTLSHTTDSLKRKQFTLTHTTDSNKKKATLKTHTTDSNKRLATLKTHTTDANKKIAGRTVSHTTDSFRRINVTKTHTTDSFKRKTNTLSHTTDSFKRKANTVSHSTSANKKKSLTVSHTTDSNKKKSGLTVTHTTDSFKKKTNTVSHTTDTRMYTIFAKAHTTDANKRKTGLTVSHTTDSNKKKTATLSHTTDANKRKSLTVSHTTDSNKRKATLVTHTTDSLKRKANTLSHTTDSFKRVAHTLTHTTDSFIRKSNTRSHTTDSNKKKSGITLTHTTDVNKRKALTVSHTTDSFKRVAHTLTHTTDSFKRKQFSLTHTTNSFLRKANTRSHTTDSNKRLATLKTHTTDANKKKSLTVFHTTDTNKKKSGNTLSHTTDSFLRKANTRSHTTDANRRKATLVSHTTDANKKLTNLKSHTTDANKKIAGFTVSHTTSSNKRKSNNLLTHTTDSFKRKAGTLSHTTDSNKKKSITISHTTDAYITYDDYSRQDLFTLPADDTTLSTRYTGTERVNVAADDNTTYVDLLGFNYLVHEFKHKHSTNTSTITPTCNLKTTLAPSLATVYMQVYNQSSGLWETIDTESVASANTDFTLTGSITVGVSNYYNAAKWVSCRVYQRAA